MITLDRITKHSSKINAAILVAVAPLIAIKLWSAIWGVYAGYSGQALKKYPTVETVSIAETSPSNEYNPFLSPDEPSQIKESNINYVLDGVLKLEQGASIALIRKKGASEARSYSVGDKLPGERVLIAVRDSYVLLEHRAQQEKLSIIREDLSNGVIDPATNKEKVIKLVESANDITFVPVFDRMEIVGFQVSGTNSKALLKKYGFKSNDIAVSIDGKKITSFKGVDDIMSLMSEKEVVVKVKRDGRYENVNVKFD